MTILEIIDSTMFTERIKSGNVFSYTTGDMLRILGEHILGDFMNGSQVLRCTFKKIPNPFVNVLQDTNLFLLYNNSVKLGI